VRNVGERVSCRTTFVHNAHKIKIIGKKLPNQFSLESVVQDTGMIFKYSLEMVFLFVSSFFLQSFRHRRNVYLPSFN